MPFPSQTSTSGARCAPGGALKATFVAQPPLSPRIALRPRIVQWVWRSPWGVRPAGSATQRVAPRKHRASQRRRCPEGSTNATARRCPAGTWSATLGAKAESTCVTCPAGTFSATVGATSSDSCVPCPAGTWMVTTSGAKLLDEAATSALLRAPHRRISPDHATNDPCRHRSEP